MLLKTTAIAAIATLSLASAHAAPAPTAPLASTSQGLEVSAPLKLASLDAKRLMSMNAGQKVDITFPVVGKKTVVFESLTKGQDGTRYWHGRLDGQFSDRVFLKETAQGFVGAIRFGARQVAFAQFGAKPMKAVDSLPPVAGQPYALSPSRLPGIHDVQGQFSTLAQAEAGSEIALPLPNGQVEVAVVTGSQLDQDGMLQIQGVSRMDGAGSPTVMTIGTEGVFGTIYSNGREYQIITRNGKTQLIDPEGAGWTKLRGENDHIALGADGGEATAMAAGTSTTTVLKAGTTTTTTTTTTTPTQPTPLAAGTVDTVITLYATYSPTFVSQYGTEALARLRISNIVQVANAAYANSGTGIQFRIVGWQNVAQADTTPQTSLPALRGGTGAFSSVPTNRKNAGAAMTVFFSPFTTTTGSTNTCGLGYMPGASSQGLTIYKAQAPTSLFTVVNDGQYNGYYCETLTTAHEFGHNLGNAHDKANSSTSGVFAYSYGKGVSGTFGTVMSYISPRVALFSSPQLKCGSTAQPCGTTSENVVATMLQTKSTVAALGNTTKTSQESTGYNLVSGWLLNSSGAPYTATGVTVRATPTSVTCTTGKTGLYVCQAPSAVTSFTVSAVATGKTITPSQGTILVTPSANTPVNGTRFYIK